MSSRRDLDTEREFLQLLAAGHSKAAAAREVGRSEAWAYLVLNRHREENPTVHATLVDPLPTRTVDPAWVRDSSVGMGLLSQALRARISLDVGDTVTASRALDAVEREVRTLRGSL